MLIHCNSTWRDTRLSTTFDLPRHLTCMNFDLQWPLTCMTLDLQWPLTCHDIWLAWTSTCNDPWLAWPSPCMTFDLHDTWLAFWAALLKFNFELQRVYKKIVSLNKRSLQDKIDLIWKSVHTSSEQSNQNITYSKVDQFCIARSLTFLEFEIIGVWNYKSDKVAIQDNPRQSKTIQDNPRQSKTIQDNPRQSKTIQDLLQYKIQMATDISLDVGLQLCQICNFKLL